MSNLVTNPIYCSLFTATLRQHLVRGNFVLPVVDSPRLDLLQFCLPTCNISVSPPPSLLRISLIIACRSCVPVIGLPLYFVLRMKGHMQEMNLTFRAVSIPVPQVSDDAYAASSVWLRLERSFGRYLFGMAT